MSQLTSEDIAKVARLARLNVTDEEAERLKQQLGDILDYVHRLDQVETTDVLPMAHAIEVTNRFRKDDPRDSLSRADALSNAPQTDGRYFLVPPILDEQ